MEDVQRTHQHPEEAPAYISATEVDALLENGFFATSSTRPKDRIRVQLGIAPLAMGANRIAVPSRHTL